jgi:hypothetical protein
VSASVDVRPTRARKEHRCGDCAGSIRPGETYDLVAGANLEGDFVSYKTHRYGGGCHLYAREPVDSGFADAD